MSDSFQQINSQRTHKLDEEEKKKELIDYLLEGLENKEKDSNVSTNGSGNGTQNVELKSDMYEGQIKDGEIQYMYFFDPDSKTKDIEDRNSRISEAIMLNDGGTLTQQLTKEELARKNEVFALYEAARDIATGERRQLDIYSKEFKEVYNSNYEKLKNSAVD